MLFVVRRSIFVHLWLFAAVLKIGRTEDVPSSLGTPDVIRLRRQSLSTTSSCIVPQHPKNGGWKLHREFCDHGTDCDIPQGVGLQVGSHLVFRCDPGYNIEGNIDVYCTAKGSWSSTLKCIEIKCERLNSVSRIATCYRSDTSVNCDSPVHPDTRAEVSCRPGYTKDTSTLLEQGETVACNASGHWEPDPIRCEPACGVKIFRQTALILDGIRAEVADFPWHASIYLRTNKTQKSRIEFACGATMIRDNLFLTVAHCITNRRISRPNPKNILIMTGNNYRDWDDPNHDLQVVKKGQVKNTYVHPKYDDTYSAGDIALLELEQPFVLSRIVLPACLDVSGNGEQILETGAYGKVAGFGRTEMNNSSRNLRTVDVPYVSYNECKLIYNKLQPDLIGSDALCAGYVNVSKPDVCSGDSGGGLVFNKNDKWYVMGIHSAGTKDCAAGYPSIYTKVSVYLPWILNVMFNLERFGSHPPSSRDMSPVQTPAPSAIPTPTSMTPENPISDSSTAEFSCLVPPQPANGEWTFHGNLCGSNRDCKIPQGTLLKPGSQLVYTCASGYRTSGHNEIYCRESGDWSGVVTCTEVKCDALNSVSTTASCSHSGKRVSCDFPVSSGTRAEVSCNLGYKKDAVFTATRRETVNCTVHGKWEPEPIKCVPVCGIAITHQTPNSIGGTTANLGDFPWHASIYSQTKSSRGAKKILICGATIIHTNFLLTAAHCVYDETRAKTEDPKKLFVMTGNIFRDYDYEGHSNIVRKSPVKNVYKHLNYYGLLGNFVSDIALLELQQPFVFSSLLLPACLDVDGYSEQILESGALGKVAGFGRTATSSTSAILQTLTVPYVTYSQCKSSKSAQFNDFFISNDKFCAGYTNGTSVCDGDSGGGLVFRRNDQWYVMGIVSVSLGVDLENGEKKCDKYSYALYSKVSTYMQWIHDVIANPERYKL